MPEFLKEIDTKLFLFFNNYYCAFCDFIFYWASDRFIWIPFYFFIAIILYRKFKTGIWKVLLAVGVLILLSDQLSVFIKNYVMRYRPCHNLIIQSKIDLINGICGGQYGFISSHAANSMALATFIFLLMEKKLKWITILLFSWCGLVSYSRIYLGTHYPLDVAGGFLTGFLMAWVIFYFYEKFLLKEKIKS
ncbi:MAG: phosphatase PAP2 family protein [Bacteroidota bacterium]